jgi:hypothetical protein
MEPSRPAASAHSVDFGAALRALWVRIEALNPSNVEGHVAAVRAFCAQAHAGWPPAALVGAVLDTQLAVMGRLDGERWRVRAVVDACYAVER